MEDDQSAKTPNAGLAGSGLMGMGPTNGPDASRIDRPISSMGRMLVDQGRIGLAVVA